MSRFVAIAAAVALVVSGVVIGVLGTFLVRGRPPLRQAQHQPAPPPPEGPFTREMETRLGLSADQRKQIQVILRESRDESDAIRRELRPRLEAQLAATRSRIAALLTPEQRGKFEQLVREDQRRADRFFLEGPPPPAGPGRPGPPPWNDRPPVDDPPPGDRPPR